MADHRDANAAFFGLMLDLRMLLDILVEADGAAVANADAKANACEKRATIMGLIAGETHDGDRGLDSGGPAAN